MILRNRVLMSEEQSVSLLKSGCGNGEFIPLGIHPSPFSLNQNQIDQALAAHFQKPLAPAERMDWRHSTVEAGSKFFVPRPTATSKKVPSQMQNAMPAVDTISPEDMCKAVSDVTEQVNKKNPLAMAALAGFVNEKIIRPKKIRDHFQALTMTGPAATDKSMFGCPHCHSIVGQKLTLVDWVRTFRLEISCPGCGQGSLQNDRTNFSKNKLPFPIFGLTGAPDWCMTMSVTCPCCNARHNANDGVILVQIPACAANERPVEPKCALLSGKSLFGRTATDMLDQLTPTHGNGEFCS